jgi:hypothetical protein
LIRDLRTVRKEDIQMSRKRIFQGKSLINARALIWKQYAWHVKRTACILVWLGYSEPNKKEHAMTWG